MLAVVALVAVFASGVAYVVVPRGGEQQVSTGLTSFGAAEPTLGGTSAAAPTTEPSGSRAPAALARSTSMAERDTVTLAFGGDLLPHSPITAQAARYGAKTNKRFDFDPMLGPMKPIISGADVAICHMETPVAPDQDRLTGYPAFGGPVELVDGARNAGYDGCSNASNHSLDRGRDGIAATLDRFDQDGLHHAGTARSAEEAATTTFYDVQGVKVAHLSYAYGFNGYKLPADAPFAANLIDVVAIRSAAAKARSEGADLVVLSLHWGTEYQQAPSADQQAVADQLLPSPDIDLIVGSHAHVVQPIDQVDGTYVVWGMGNQLANQMQTPKADGLTAVATAERNGDGHWKVVGVEGVPTLVEPGTFRVLPVVPTLADGSISPALRSALSASYDRSAATILGNHPPGVTVAPKPA